MNVINKIRPFLNSTEFLAYLIALVLSTLFIGYAPSSIALGLFVLFSVRHKILNWGDGKLNLALLLPISLYLLFILTWFWTVDKSLTKIGLQRTACLFLVPFAFTIIPKITLKNLQLILNIFTWSNVFFGCFFLIDASINFFNTHSFNSFTYHNLVSVLDLNAIYVSLIFSISLFYLISKSNKSIKDKLLILFFFILLLLLSSKMILLILLIGVFFYIYKNRNIKFYSIKLLSVIVILFIIIGLSSITLTKRILVEKETNINEIITKKEFGNIYPWTGSSIRLLQLRILKEQIVEETIFWRGFGLFASRQNVKKRHQEFGTYYTFHNYNYHNQYAQILSETGVFGLILLLAMILIAMIKAIRTNNFLFIMFCVTTTMMFFTESLLWRQQGLFVFIIFYCLISSSTLNKKSLNTKITQ